MKPRPTRRFEGKAAIVTGAATGMGAWAAIVTGAATGMGACAAEMFAAEGAAVVVADVAAAPARDTVQRIEADGGRAIFVATDVTRAGDCQQCVERALHAFGRLDCLFNNAGIVGFGTAETVSEDDWDRIMAVALKGTFLMTKYAVPAMRASGGGAIVNSGSNVAHFGIRNMAAYTAAKAAMPVLTKSMAIDFWPDRIRVNCVSPGFVQTPMAQSIHRTTEGIEPTPEEVAAWQRPEAIAEAVLFLSAHEHAWDITGVTLPVSQLTYAQGIGPT